MYDQNPSPDSSSSPRTAVGRSCHHQRRRRHMMEEDEGDLAAACTGESCQSCTAWVIADCVAICCCPFAVVNLLTLTFLKLPWAVARRCIRRLKKEKIRKIKDKERRCGGGDRDGISRKERVNEGIVWEEGGAMDNLGAVFSAEEIWLELYEVGHLAFGRVSFSGNILKGKGQKGEFQ